MADRKPVSWTCPYCAKPQIATEQNSYAEMTRVFIGAQKYGPIGVWLSAVACVNPDCEEVELQAEFIKGKLDAQHKMTAFQVVEKYRLRPSSTSKPQPDYIPAPLREDYVEACKIRDLSPKASATLARRCLQGAIRNFCGIAKARLIDEISALREQVEKGNAPQGVSHETVDAIDHVRSIGNIGAHMEKDINLVIDVDPGEAQALIELIELLFDEWYVARHKRQERLAAVLRIKEEKAGERKGPKPAG